VEECSGGRDSQEQFEIFEVNQITNSSISNLKSYSIKYYAYSLEGSIEEQYHSRIKLISNAGAWRSKLRKGKRPYIICYHNIA